MGYGYGISALALSVACGSLDAATRLDDLKPDGASKTVDTKCVDSEQRCNTEGEQIEICDHGGWVWQRDCTGACRETIDGPICLSACQHGKTESCGNRLLDACEICDGDLLDSKSCTTVEGSFIGGVLRCMPDCWGFDTSGCEHDAGPSTVGVRCDPTKPFGAPAVATELGAGKNPWLTADESTIYFDRLVPSQGLDLFTATRGGVGATFTTPTGLSSVNSIEADYGPSLSLSGLNLYFVRSGYQAYMATRSSTALPFPVGSPLSLGGPRSIATPRTSASGGMYYLGWTTGVRPALFVDGPPTWSPTSALTFADGLESFSVSHDELVLYFSASPDGGRRSVYRSSRTSLSTPFNTVTAVAELNQLTPSIRGVAVSWVSADECSLYGTAEFASENGDHRIVHAMRPPY